ncbi:MAG TPA: alpha-amylase family glycosyl hydrolase [Acidobacteriaceae bacterium]|nr:alpha-amylase family glycosyl hydrolase [Acidobacteriaceae bacterium]
MRLRCLFIFALAAVLCTFSQGTSQAQTLPSTQKLPWYVTAGAIHRVTLKPHTRYWRFEHLSMDPATAKQQMLTWKSEGITALEIFAPEDGGNSYDGLDAKDRFRLDPGLGSMADFKRLVALAHSLGMRVITFQNLGYSATDGVQFEKAEAAVRNGKSTRETKVFYWSHSVDAPKPAASNSYFFCRPDLPNYDPAKAEFWQWSSRAQAYYWTRWPGKDANGQTIHLPQYNWSGTAWPDEAAHVVHFWMNTGLDGMVLDAVNWYAGADWQKIDQDITGVIASYGNMLSQPEGGGGFSDDPVGWVKEGNFTNIYDYRLGIWWEKKNRPLVTSVEQENPAIFEEALRRYHDRVVAAGGTLYFPVPALDNPDDQQFAEALIATSGDMPCFCDPVGGITAPAKGIPQLLKLKPLHPALFQNSLRRRVATSDDAHLYAIERYAANNSERLLLIFNFSNEPENASVDLGAIHGSEFIDLMSGERAQTTDERLPVSLPAHGYRIFRIVVTLAALRP